MLFIISFTAGGFTMLPAHEYANDLILFALIVDCGSFSKAAEMAGVTGSVLSKRVGRLEKASAPVFSTVPPAACLSRKTAAYCISMPNPLPARFTVPCRQSVPTVMN